MSSRGDGPNGKLLVQKKEDSKNVDSIYVVVRTVNEGKGRLHGLKQHSNIQRLDEAKRKSEYNKRN